MRALAWRDHCGLRKIIARPACENYNLEVARLLDKQGPKPIHSRVITLDELVVENDGSLQVFRQRQTVQSGQLLARADRHTFR